MSDYTTREMMEGLKQTPAVRNFLSRTFFPTSNTHIAEKIEIDVKKGKRRMAPLVSPRKGGKVMTREGFETNFIMTPKIAPERIITSDDITKRSIGESSYSKRTPKQRGEELLLQDMMELQEAIERRKEWEAREVIVSGGFRVVDEEEGLDVQVDYHFTNKVILSGSQTWDNADSDPLAVLKLKRREIIQKTGVSPDIILMAADASTAFLSHPKVKEEMGIRSLSNVVVKPLAVDPALTYIGKVADLGCEIYTYDEWYVDDNDVEQPMIPPGMVIMASSKGIGSFEYGAVTQLDDGKYVTYAEEAVPKRWTVNEQDIEKLRLTSRPVPRPDNVDSWYVLQVL